MKQRQTKQYETPTFLTIIVLQQFSSQRNYKWM